MINSFDAAGNPQWSILAGNPNANITDMATDTLGNFYITGGSQRSVRLGTTTVGLGFFLAKYTGAGQLLWARGEQQTAGVTSSNNYAVGWSLNPTNDGVTLLVQLTAPLYRSSMLDSLVVSSEDNIVHYSPLGVPQWLLTTSTPPGSSGASYTGFYAFSDLHTDARGNLYGTGRIDTAPRLPGVLGNPVVLFGPHTTVGSGNVTFRINAQANTLRGLVYFDQNSNGRQDVGENSFPRSVTGVLTQGSATSYTAVASDGQLQTFATPGAYTLSLAALPHYTVSQPGSGRYTGTFSGRNQLVVNQTFGLAPVANQPDLRATLTPYTSARPGFVTHYRLTLENVGTTTLPSGTATLVLDSRMTYISSTPSAARTGQTLTWTYASLAPFGRNEYDVLFSLPTNATPGAVLNTAASAPVTGDVAPTDNAATLAQTVVSSYDPNSIEVSYERLTPAQVAAQQPLDYTIHFQNLGTASAVNVLLSDTLDFRKLNPATLMLIAQSHNCIWSLTSLKPNTGLLTVRFLNINLPERNLDVIRSQGFVRFRVQPRTTLAVGDIVPNTAGIVFDYNAPVITNTATTTVMLTSATLANHTAAAWNAYPNPATDAVTIAADLKAAGPVRLDLLDALGRTVRQQTLTAPAGPLRQTLDLRGLAPGFYVLRLTPPTGPASSQQLVRE
ncbi:T9SS type A sorting domain-containing protein [Hymenobacter sp. M29]|uniref:T9SS type A sorting domain-containing protein n=1 Tax=Hymenobacter mellowenesis TaxID=3063995 RepID=A0ABT9AG60_9BACT|nr:T9SS type A sorting domain-containing protein [Hymenobacter sp. M29]MDO7848836.1 T9SS type A sorting domain-containing protein [Hymenobacter sp. M29]